MSKLPEVPGSGAPLPERRLTPQQLEAVIRRAVALRPKDRFASCDEMRDALLAAAAR